MSKPRFYVTTPIYYVNAEPHLGHACTTVIADTLKRYYLTAGYDTFFLTGTDEHGNKVAEAAEKAGKTPKEFTDEISGTFRRTWQEMNICNDRFIRTTDPEHERVVRMILQRLYDKGDIYFSDYSGYYCFGCERFHLRRELVDGKCPDHQVEPTFIKESNYLLRLSTYQEWLVDHINSHPDFIIPDRYRNEVLAILREPLGDLCISRPRSRLEWGITLPFDSNFVTYVWVDALINYLTGIGYPDGPLFDSYWPVCTHLIAKDILKHHAIYWPIILRAAGIEMFRRLGVHGYWTVDGAKMSKSIGNVVEPLQMQHQYGSDAFRYFLLRESVFGLDADFSERALVGRINADLANDLGNLVHRVLNMVSRYRDGVVPAPAGDVEGGNRLEMNLAPTAAAVKATVESLQFNRALEAIWDYIRTANQYVEEHKPWELAKDPSRRGVLDTVLYNLVEALRLVAVFVGPFLPATSATILRQLGETEDPAPLAEALTWGILPPLRKVTLGPPLFPRIELSEP